MRPLYRTDVAQADCRPSGHAGIRFDKFHAGLWFDKFCDTWAGTPATPVMSAKEKLRWISTVTRAPIGDREQIKEQARRQAHLVQKLGGRFAVFTTESRFVTGLGCSHPIENGFAWHPVLGTPYLTGSSLKGLLLAWARENVATEADDELLVRLFGGPGRAGGVCFFDATPTARVQLEADVMTPHYAGWTGDDPPGDWRSPKPIPFLVTAAGTPFLFGFVPRRPLDDGDLDSVLEWLCAALEWAGGGAKTAVGYGRFRHDGGQTRILVEELEDERARAAAGKTPEGRWRLKLEGKSEAEVLDLVRIHLDKKPLADPGERQVFARTVSTRFPVWVEAWRSGKPGDRGTNIGKKKLKKRAQLLDNELT